MSDHRFPLPFAPRLGHRCHQEQKEAALVDDRRCGRYRLAALVGDKSICVLVPERVLFHQGEARLDRHIVGNTIYLREILYR